jgi:hypothetical protein
MSSWDSTLLMQLRSTRHKAGKQLNLAYLWAEQPLQEDSESSESACRLHENVPQESQLCMKAVLMT